MRIAFLASDKPRERLLADAVLRGCRRHGHEVTMIPLGQDPDPGAYEVVGLVGVKSRERFRAHLKAGAHVLYLDKGYDRHKTKGSKAGWEYWRVAIDTHHPTALLGELSLPDDRLRDLGWRIKPWRTPTEDGEIIIAGSSEKYHDFYGLSHPTTYARGLVQDIRAVSERPLAYRPKPSWDGAIEIKKARYSVLPEQLCDMLKTAHLLVTHGSNACFEAVMAGVPCIITGDGVAKPISDVELTADTVETPYLATEAERLRWAANIAHFQWTLAEFASGKAWDFLGETIHAV